MWGQGEGQRERSFCSLLGSYTAWEVMDQWRTLRPVDPDSWEVPSCWGIVVLMALMVSPGFSYGSGLEFRSCDRVRERQLYGNLGLRASLPGSTLFSFRWYVFLKRLLCMGC